MIYTVVQNTERYVTAGLRRAGRALSLLCQSCYRVKGGAQQQDDSGPTPGRRRNHGSRAGHARGGDGATAGLQATPSMKGRHSRPAAARASAPLATKKNTRHTVLETPFEGLRGEARQREAAG